MTQHKTEETRCGFVALVGRPNVGKSTLLNHLIGQKLAITSRRPQTTRHKLTGIYTRGRNQILFVDTPGLYQKPARALDLYMHRVAGGVLSNVDIAVMVVDRDHWTPEDDFVLKQVRESNCRALLAINKIDLMRDKRVLLPFLTQKQHLISWMAMIPVAALKGEGLPELVQKIAEELPIAAHLFPPDQLTDRDEKFLAAEIVREQIMRQVGDEVPYRTNVQIENFKKMDGVLHIGALIIVEQSGQQGILIGRGGRKLKAIGRSARIELERLFKCQVMLRSWVKIRSNWSSQAADLKTMEYDRY